MSILRVVEEHAEAEVLAAGGNYTAEVKVTEFFEEATVRPKDYYVIAIQGNIKVYAVSEKSINDPEIAEDGNFPDFIEEFKNIDEAKSSKYGKFFGIAQRLLDDLG